MRFVLIALVCAATCALRAGVAVDAQTDVPRRICTNEMTLAWDWSWDWIPVNAQAATIVAKMQGGGVVFSNTVARPATSVTWRVFETPSAILDAAYDVTLSFPLAEKLTASRTFSCELRAASFAPHVRACETNSPAWRRFELPTAFAYNANWFPEATNIITYIQWKNLDDPSVPLIRPPSEYIYISLGKAQGFLPVPKDYLPRATYLASIHEMSTRLAQCEISNVTGVMIIFR